MPVVQEGNGFNFSGKVVAWIEEIEQWYKALPNPSLSFADWSALIIYAYSLYAREKWRNEWLNKQKAEKLDEWLPTNKDLVVNAGILQVLDFLAENLNDTFRREHAGEAKAYANRFTTYQTSNERR